MLSLLALAPTSAITYGAECDKTAATTIKLKWDSFASEWGQYTIDGCNGVAPKLKLAAGVTYTWDQSDVSNWYHPVGFSYIAGGAHTVCKQDSAGTEGECPELGGASAASGVAGTPSTLQYYVSGNAVTSDDSGFGLDAYEPLFFNSQGWWSEQSPAFYVTLAIPSDASYTRIYYFCHIHAGMSAEIEIVGSTAAAKTVLDAASLGGETEASALAIYDSIVTTDQPPPAAFDEACGTHGSAAYDPAVNAACASKHFLCGDGATDTFSQCLMAIDCEMHEKMAVSVPNSAVSKFATFARQMIPHHQNAVAMAKALLKNMAASDFPPDFDDSTTPPTNPDSEDVDKPWAEALAREIINVQNQQIQAMQGWLDSQASLAGTSEMCYDVYGDPTPGALGGGAIAGVAVGVAIGGALLGLGLGKVLFGAKAAGAKAAKAATAAATAA